MTTKRVGTFTLQTRRPSLTGQVVLFVVFWILAAPLAHGQAEEQQPAFEISAFEVEGNTLLLEAEIQSSLAGFAGPSKTAEDVETARDTLEGLYHKKGYPTVLVNIPEQTVEEGVVRLRVLESKIRRVKVTGNRYFTMDKILRELPSFRPGEILYVPKVEAELNKVNRNPDFKVAPVLMPGKEAGAIDVELKVKDRLPLHGSVELNNRSTHDTTDLRLNAMIRYDNLWQKEHSISFQYQTSPEDKDEVQVAAGSYVLPAPWKDDHLVALYGIWSDSDTAIGEGFDVVGKGNIFGARYVMPLPSYKLYTHNVTLGLDYKDFDETTGFQGEEEDLRTPLTYVPLSLSYSSSLFDSWGHTRFSGGLNMAFRGLVNDQREFEEKRFRARGNYVYATLGVERMQKLPADMTLFLKLDGQVSDQPLISNEQFSAGGMNSVRGYKESEVLGDDAFHTTVEFSAPDLADLFKVSDYVNFTPYLFYDFAALRVRSPLEGQDSSPSIQGAGVGVRGYVSRFFEFQSDWAVALSDTDQTEKEDSTFHFKVKCLF
ncbi:MAG: ShlB/FhaC/HecB family hemolysin secretion/activation protein [Thermodesulfobacteriota bacterium]|nr:ShlB/FhaC/HecB family hemolysin secretion/activation protein [Thermodesulfobacteriota bacterium]